MKRNTRFLFLGLMIVVVFSSVASVSADAVQQSPQMQATVTFTPSITSAPAYVPTIINPTFPSDFSCPSAGVVDGWGTTTPSVFWQLNCGQCVITPLVTSTALPSQTPTYAPTVTGTPPTATVSPTVTITPTLIGQSIRCKDGGSIGGECYQVNPSTVGGTFSYTGDNNEPYNNSGLWASIWAEGVPSFTLGQSIYVTVTQSHAKVTSYYSASRLVDYAHYSNGTMIEKLVDDASLPGYGVWEYSIPSTIQYLLTAGAGNVADGFTFYNVTTRSGSIGSYMGEGDLTVYISTTGYYTYQTPTVTPTTTPSTDYCASVDGLSGDSAFSWTGITYGESQCMDIGPYDVSILGIDIEVPWLAHLCLQEIAIGTATVFGVMVSLDVIVTVLLIGWMLRNMFVS